MARVLGLESEVNVTLRQALLNTLRAYDECRILPGACKSAESGAFKNVVVRLSGCATELSPETFSSNWFSGVSIVQVDCKQAEALLLDPEKRAAALAKLKDAIPSELADADLEVGPSLECDENDRDSKPWTAGFDGPGCCVGLYAAQQACPPEPGREGMNRLHRTYFLVCKAGGGIASQTFHARLTASLTAGKSLDQALDAGNAPGPQALRRVATAGVRNRGRILVAAANALDLDTVDTLSDQASPVATQYRCAVCPVNVTYNALRRVTVEGDRPASMWQYCGGCIDSAVSTGAMTSSNPQDGFVLFTDNTGCMRVQIRNDLYDAIPFASTRRLSNRDAVNVAADAHRRSLEQDAPCAAHPDHEWIHARFAWKSKPCALNLEPPSLWGAFKGEEWIGRWGREVGVAGLCATVLSPEVVSIAAVEGAKLRAAARHVNAKLKLKSL